MESGGVRMSTEKPRFTVTVSDEMKKSIEDFFHSRKFKNQSQAVNQLIERGLSTYLLYNLMSKLSIIAR